MPDKKQTASRFVELNLNLKVPRKQYPLVEKTLAAILDLAGLKANTEADWKRKADKIKSAPAAKRGRKPKDKPVKMKPAQGRKAAAKKISATAALIRDLRTKANLSQKALADKLGASQNIISIFETGKQKPNMDMAVKLGSIFKTPHQDFLK